VSWRAGLGWCLLAGVLVFGWLAWNNRHKPQAVAVDPNKYDYIMHDFTMVALDKEGLESVTLEAPEMRRLASDETYTITDPTFLMPDKEGAHWKMVSKTGWVAAKGEKLRMEGDVVGTSPPGTAPSTFKTTLLDIYPDQHLASTDREVVLTQPGATMSGTGFEIDSQTQQYKFKSKVRSRYVPKSAQ